MGDVLTQSEIDALLSSVINSEPGKQETALEDMSASKKERKYDFRAPKRFTKDSLKLLDSVYSNYARVVSSQLTSLLRLTCEVDLIDVEEQNFGEFANALNDNDALAVIDIGSVNGYNEDDPVILQISNAATYVIMDRMLGGSGESLDNESREFTNIELALYNDLLTHLIPPMNDVWKNYFDVKFSFANIEVNPRLMQKINVDEIVVIIVLNITVNDIAGKINICLPGNAYEFILTTLESSKTSGKRKEGQASRASDDILYNISGSALEIKVDLGEAQVKFSDIFNLKEGDIINLNLPKQSDATVYVENNPWFTAKLGAEKQKKAVMINGFASNI